jgi:hypothetical protein
MGHSWIEIEVSNLERTRLKKVNALIAGASLTVLPKKLAEELEIKPLSTDEVSTGGGMIKVGREH